MRIAFVNHSRRKVGGAEVYLDSVLSAFARAGHDVAWIYEQDPASTNEPIVEAVSDRDHWEALRQGACQQARRFQLDNHIAKLVRIFERCIA